MRSLKMSNNPRDLTGSQPTLTGTEDTLAGTSHTLPLKTAYYTAQVPIWIDIIPSPPPSSLADPTPPPPTAQPSSWSAPYLAPEAREVLSALGAFVICFRKPSTEEEFLSLKAVLKDVARVRDACSNLPGEGVLTMDWDGVCVAVGMKRGTVTGWSVLGASAEEDGEEEGEEKRKLRSGMISVRMWGLSLWMARSRVGRRGTNLAV